MSVLNDGNNLPGTLIDIENEVSSDYDPSLWGSTESVMIIGTAFQGPVGAPVRIYNADMGRYFFGASYDSATHRSASLVPGIQAAYERGCRTIYAMRVGGKDIYKDFRFCEGSNTYRLRIQSTSPTNTAKKSYVKINVNSGFEQITLYKPAEKATIAEKKQGIVDSKNSMIMVEMKLNEDAGLTRNDKLIDLIQQFNGNARNNVFTMAVVDEDGNDVTNTPEAQSLHIGSLFNGIYFVGRDKNTDSVPAYTIVAARAIVSEDDPKPYSSYEDAFYYVLNFNSDVSVEYPIYATNYDVMKNLLTNASVTAGTDYDFLKTSGLADRVWKKDEVDYEEADLSNFDLYKKLGSGFAITAKAVKRNGLDSHGNERRPRIVETPAEDENHIVPLIEGVYSLIQDTEVNYRVLVAANADDKITAKLPKADEFKRATPNSVKLLGNPNTGDGALIEATPIIGEQDFSATKEYEFHFVKVAEEDMEFDTITDIYTDHVAKIVARIDGGEEALKTLLSSDSYPDGTLFMVFDDERATSGKLYRSTDSGYELMNIANLADELYSIQRELYVGVYNKESHELTFEAADITLTEGKPSTFKGKEYILIDNGHSVFVSDLYNSDKNPGKAALRPLGALEDMLGDNDDKTMIYVEDAYGQKNRIRVTTGAADFVPLEEFMDILQNDTSLGSIFTFELTQEGANSKDMYPEEIEDNFVTEGYGDYYFEQDRVDASAPGVTNHFSGAIYSLHENKSIGYDYSLYIPYRTNDNFVRQLAQHCAYSSLRTSMTHGIIGYSPLRNFTLASVSKRVDDLLASDFSLYAKKNNGRMMLNSDNNPYEIGGNVSVTSFQYPITDTVNNITTTVNGAAGYAGLISTLPVEQSTTMQSTNLPSVDYTFSNSQLLSVINAGFVATKNTDAKGICIADGVTMAPSTEFRARLSIVRTMNACGDAIRAAAEPYIGKKNSLQNRSALKTAVDSALNNLTDTLIWDYKFDIVNFSSYTSDNHIDINYEIYPMNEIRSVVNSIVVSHQSTATA